ncbi:MAG: hypothetical protein K6T80_05705, partial [Firmicutes bacterium]|nr:hypothetical protein [Bacillota bacterium]
MAQNPNTFEILAWKDALGNVYTGRDLQVRLFPYALFVLGLVEAAVLTGVYHLLKWHCGLMLLFKYALQLPRPFPQ